MHTAPGTDALATHLHHSVSVVSPGDTGTFLNDMWRFDYTSSGWERVTFANRSIVSCPASGQLNINTQMPDIRAGLEMVGVGATSIMCGGYKINSAGHWLWSKDASGSCDCWWFTPLPEPRWDALKLVSGSAMPAPRHSGLMVVGLDKQPPNYPRLLIIGGQGEGESVLGDCWFLETSSSDAPAIFGATYSWKKCDVAKGELTMPGRFGHGGVFFRGDVYVFGGFASDGLGGKMAMRDMWRLTNFESSSRKWVEVMPSSSGPTARAFHSMWLTGSKLILHGGQASEGTGLASVVSDTWSFDLFSQVWTLYGSTSDLPVVSHMLTASATDVASIAFGGKSPSGVSSARLYKFDSQTSWSRCEHFSSIPPFLAPFLSFPVNMYVRTYVRTYMHINVCGLNCGHDMPCQTFF